MAGVVGALLLAWPAYVVNVEPVPPLQFNVRRILSYTGFTTCSKFLAMEGLTMR